MSLGGALRQFNEDSFLLIEYLLIEVQFFEDYVVPFLLQFEIQAMFCLIVILSFHLQKFCHGSIEGVEDHILKLLQ
jgi:hypothetical protein